MIFFFFFRIIYALFDWFIVFLLIVISFLVMGLGGWIDLRKIGILCNSVIFGLAKSFGMIFS